MIFKTLSTGHKSYNGLKKAQIISLCEELEQGLMILKRLLDECSYYCSPYNFCIVWFFVRAMMNQIRTQSEGVQNMNHPVIIVGAGLSGIKTPQTIKIQMVNKIV